MERKPWFGSRTEAFVAGHLLGQLFGSIMITALLGIAQMLLSIPLNWWILVFLFLISFGGMAWNTWQVRKKEKQIVSAPAIPVPSVAAPAEVAKVEPEPEPESPNSAPLYFLAPTRSYVNPLNKNGELKLSVFLLNGGTAKIHLGKPRWKAHMGQAFGYPRNIPLQYEYVGGRGQDQQRLEEIDIESGQRVELSLLLDPKPALDPNIGFKKVFEWKNMYTLGTMTIPLTFGGNGQYDLSFPL